MSERITLKGIALEHGAEKMRFFFPARRLEGMLGIQFVSGSDPGTVVEGRADESLASNRKITAGYKVRLVPLDAAFGYEEFYNGDFESLSETFPDEYYVMVDDKKFVMGHHK